MNVKNYVNLLKCASRETIPLFMCLRSRIIHINKTHTEKCRFAVYTVYIINWYSNVKDQFIALHRGF